MLMLMFERCKVVYFHGDNTGVKVLSMKINYLTPFKHKHKQQKFAHENYLPRIPALHWIGVMTFSMKISYLTSVQCMTQVSKCYP
jgi:hypothetical protein